MTTTTTHDQAITAIVNALTSPRAGARDPNDTTTRRYASTIRQWDHLPPAIVLVDGTVAPFDTLADAVAYAQAADGVSAILDVTHILATQEARQ